ncbi:hypothetical protein [Lysinibacter cavernae]|uniref:hypothetical protein n=1 Tax=Lysinibacter cavernae TaxID=1640652 RepID=UPI003607F8E2
MPEDRIRIWPAAVTGGGAAGVLALVAIFFVNLSTATSAVNVGTGAGQTWSPGVFGLIGSVVGGSITGGVAIFLNSRQREDAKSMRVAEWENSTRRQQVQWDNERANRAAESLHEDAKELLEIFVSVHRKLQVARDRPTNRKRTYEDWHEIWDKIWTPDISLTADVLADLLVDPAARQTIKRVVQVLDGLKDITDPAAGIYYRKNLLTNALGTTAYASGAITQSLVSSSTEDERKHHAIQGKEFHQVELSMIGYNRYKGQQIARAESAEMFGSMDEGGH